MVPIKIRLDQDDHYDGGNKIEYIVVHGTGNTTDSDEANANYFCTGIRNASAHYFIDDDSITQVVKDTDCSWHCGDGHGAYGITNRNSIGIEMCCTNRNYSSATQKNTIDLIVMKMKQYNVPLSKVVRHYDASRKNCPSGFSANNWAAWYTFKNNLAKALNPSPSPSTVPSAPANVYRIRLTWDNIKSQKGAYSQLDGAKSCADANPGYKVFDWNGKVVYPVVVNPQPVPDNLYRIRLSWGDVKSQIGAFKNLDSAKQICDQNKGYHVYDENGKPIYPAATAPSPSPQPVVHMYRIRLTWDDAKSQVGAFSVLDNAKTDCNNHPGYSVFDESGNNVYTCQAKPQVPVSPIEPKPADPVVPQKPKTLIMGAPVLKKEQMIKYLLDNNVKLNLTVSTEELVSCYLEEGVTEGVRGDIAFCQSMKETGFFKFGGQVLPEQNNFAGIGATNNSATGKGAWFKTAREGVRAQIQHLKAYGSKEALKQTCVDPRYSLVTKGIAPNWEDLNGYWAVPGVGYGESILSIYEKVKTIAFEKEPTSIPEPTPTEDPEVPTSDDKTVEKNIILKLLQLIIDLVKKLF